MYEVGIITASDKGSRGERTDVSGPAIRDLVEAQGYRVKALVVLPDDEDLLHAEMVRMADVLGLPLILTTGGTGFSVRDVTPEATLRAVERLVPGIPEAIRSMSLKTSPRAMLSRAVAGIRGRTLIVNLPGSPRAVTEALGFILASLHHGLQILLGDAGECGGESKH